MFRGFSYVIVKIPPALQRGIFLIKANFYAINLGVQTINRITLGGYNGRK